MSDVTSRLNQQLNFLMEIDQLKAVYRKMKVQSDNLRYENSAEHSWHIALQALVLHEYAPQTVNIARVVKMLLVHDIVEIDAGDTFAFADPAILAGQNAQEQIAAERLFGLLPDDQAKEYLSLWEEFEALETEDARFAKAMDCLLPAVQNMHQNGGSWKAHGVTKTQLLVRNQYLENAAPKLWDYFLHQIDTAVTNGWIVDN